MKLGMFITGIILVVIGVILGVFSVYLYTWGSINPQDMVINWAGITLVGVLAFAVFIAGLILSIVGAHKT